MYAFNFKQVGANIQQKLVLKGMTQQNLADKLHISKQVMSKIINGNKAINVAELAGIAQYLDTTTDELLKAPEATTINDAVSFMGSIKNEETRQKIDLIRSAIDDILILEELLYV